MEEKTLASLSRLDLDNEVTPERNNESGTWWTDEDTDNPEDMFLVENKDGQTVFLLVKDNKIHEKDCVTGDVYIIHDLGVITNLILPGEEEGGKSSTDCLEIKLTFDSRVESKPEASYTFEDVQSFNLFKDRFIQPAINRQDKLVSSYQQEGLPKREIEKSNLDKIYRYVEKLPSVRLVQQGKSDSIDNKLSGERKIQNAWWTKEDVENPDDMYLVENKEGKTVFLFVKDNIIHEKDSVTGDVWINHDLGVITNAIFPDNGSKSLEIKLSFDSRVQSKKEARYSFENQSSFKLFKEQFVQPAINRRAKQLSQGKRKFECLKCGFSEIASQSHEKNNSCPQCSSIFTFFTNDR
ncbi:uncharacterized protein LOC128394914 [Panonychus citri]|uniref:uncharacterized protein LOC128394914 n=1 Tax=Panonychus citri TaxID=50023 RepID=UPI002306E27B|nr:uncharacterized protein LOC128394914 [Panonychus citri]